MIHVGIAIAILMGSLLLGVSIPFAFGAGTIYMYTMLGGTFATTLPVGFNGINTMVLLAIPTFIMAGGFIEKGKVGDELPWSRRCSRRSRPARPYGHRRSRA